MFSIIYSDLYNRDNIVYSIITPVYNQEDIIVKNIKSYISNTIDNFEIIIILDCCSDNTKENVLNFFKTLQNNNKNFIKIQILETIEPLFETKCDNIGFKLAQGKYLLEIQADMEMTQLGYNIHLTKPFNILDNVIAVSGRCTHNIYRSGGVGKLGMKIEKNIDELGIDRNIFYTYETCNRGPLLLDKDKVKELNYLDEKNYFMNNSDHDLMARAYILKKYICGYVPIDFNAPIADGSRKKRQHSDERNKKAFIACSKKENKRAINIHKGKWKELRPKKYNI
tara:strand:- start:3876 stop:4721 length:846 start_codon:yes stop_codon:yes gene_type:complete